MLEIRSYQLDLDVKLMTISILLYQPTRLLCNYHNKVLN